MASLTVDVVADTVYLGFYPPDVTGDDVKQIVLNTNANMTVGLKPMLLIDREGEESVRTSVDFENQNDSEFFFDGS